MFGFSGWREHAIHASVHLFNQSVSRSVVTTKPGSEETKLTQVEWDLTLDPKELKVGGGLRIASMAVRS